MYNSNLRYKKILYFFLINLFIYSIPVYSQFTNFNNNQKANNRGGENLPKKNNSIPPKDEVKPNQNSEPSNGQEPHETNQAGGKSENKVYDPFLDNHLKAPPNGIVIGKFGKSIKEVEKELRYLGAKDYSYAFGKYSKMIFSSYIITLNFDVNKRLGVVEITPKPPLKTIENKAKDFFVDLFIEDSDISQIGIVVCPNKLELRYLNME